MKHLEATLRQLEFNQVVDMWAEHCENEVAHAEVLATLPAFHPDVVAALQLQTAQGLELLDDLSLPHLGRIKDLELNVERLAKGGRENGEILWQIGDAMAVMRQISALTQSRRAGWTSLTIWLESMPVIPKLEERLLTSLDGGGTVRNEASVELDRIRRGKTQATQRVLERIQSYTSGRQRDLLSDPLYTQRDGRYVIPLKAENRNKIKGIVHDTSASGQTIFVEPEDVVAASNQLRELEAAERSEVARILRDLSEYVGTHGKELAEGIRAAIELDKVFSRVRFGLATGSSIPRSTAAHCLTIRHGRHPLIARDKVVPFSLSLGSDANILLITGPNTGGKTVTLKAVALFVAMAQCGLMIPAAESYVGFFPQIWADIGDKQSLEQSLSTFSGSIQNLASITKNLKPGALVVLDEVGSGTDPAEGAALARAILVFLQEKDARVLASTHHGELKLLAFDRPGFANASMEFDTRTLMPTYRLLLGTPGASHALRIAERYGLPTEIIESAKETDGQVASEISEVLERLNHAQRQAQKAQSRADQMASRLETLEKEAATAAEQADRARREARQKSADLLETTLQTIRIETAEILEDLKSNYSLENVSTARKRLRNLQEQGAEQLKSLRPERATSNIELAVDMSVKLRGQGQAGRVLQAPKDGKVLVQLGQLRLTVPVADVVPVDEKPVTLKHKPKANLGLAKNLSSAIEIQIIGLREEEARNRLVKFLDDSELAGFESVRIVHGKGQGILRKMCHEVLRAHRGVADFRLGEPVEGGDGATIARFK